LVLFLSDGTNNYNNAEMIYSSKIETPIGLMMACSTENGICLLEFMDMVSMEKDLLSVSKYFDSEISTKKNKFLIGLELQLKEYFLGTLRSFSVPVQLTGTAFQQQVFTYLQTIPYGSTQTYLEQATALNNAEAVRAVAQVNSKNTIYILVPCHRVIASNGKLTGYGAGIWRKQFLLDLEKGQKTLFL
jgi:AraC family transcriptional regulator of adaptative response/methylated-DNA-[protein]-cysteine methyltransferase